MPEQDSSSPLREGVDYYLENGRWVFTAVYHLKRGYCCDNRCRHCPYVGRANDERAKAQFPGNSTLTNDFDNQ